ncbi:cytochrome P450 [Setomelanomma holmii]|uniref:Cytochrome P450 n=1 Tax=Setomelanomma holmii TaxID=210430 RepID=A0A9P4LN71_9PLEO|nr:cytochrome P450 [Setomelanomma holmii]
MTNLTLLLLTGLVAFVLLRNVYRRIIRRNRARRNGCVAPPRYHHKDPIFGFDLFVKYMDALKAENFLDFNKQMFDKFGKTFETNVLGTRTYRTIDPEVNKAVFITYATRFGLQPLRYEVAKHLWGNGIIVVDGEHWKHGRALMRGSFEVVHLANFDRLRAHVDVFINLLPKDGSTVDLMPLFQRLILDTSSEFIFGEAMSALEDPSFSTGFTEAFAYAQKGTAIQSMLKKLKVLHRDEKWWQACKTITDYADRHVEKALQRLSERESSEKIDSDSKLQSRLRLVDEMAKDTQDRLTLHSHIISVFSPAHDGATITLTNAMFHIARHPARQCLKTTILPCGGGVDGKSPLYVEKGDNLEFNYRTMMRDKTFWGEDADDFVPERWERIRPTWEYTPFGGGPRICPGQRLVFTETVYVLVTLLRSFEKVENRDPVWEWKEEMRMTFQSKNGCLVGLIA